ncbi:MAG: hypothetical protein ACOCZL_05580 [Bacteroidota bacterium]
MHVKLIEKWRNTNKSGKGMQGMVTAEWWTVGDNTEEITPILSWTS